MPTESEGHKNEPGTEQKPWVSPKCSHSMLLRLRPLLWSLKHVKLFGGRTETHKSTHSQEGRSMGWIIWQSSVTSDIL
eukprot:Skav230331  [mRNA]  locus=scaffold551:234721:234954:+ [translate_table: standard]